MHLTLKPLTQPDLPEIQIDDALFAIGRTEEPFVTYQKSLVSRLSKRHAKIFEQDGVVYMADLGSRNGTTLNGNEVVDVPQRLKNGDEIQLGGLRFQVTLEDVDATAFADIGPPPEIKLVLSPLASDRGLKSIVVTQFPFLVHRHGDAFSLFHETVPDQMEFISKRHAHFFYRAGKIWVEDLGSTNGTLLNDKKLEEKASELNDGDTVAFGGDYFAYRVRILVSDDADETVVAEIDDIEKSTGTIFVRSATSFVDIFLTQDPPDHLKPKEQAAVEPVSSKARIVEQPKKKSRVAIWSILIVTGGIFAIAWYLFNPPSLDNLNQMLERGEFRNAAAAANRRLDGVGDDPGLVRVATLAALQGYLPAWIEQLRTDDVQGARQTVQTLRLLGVNNPGDDAYIELLGWAVDIHDFLRGKTPVNATTESIETSRLIDWWRIDIDARTNTLDEITRHVPSFERSRRRILAQVRTLMVREQNLLESPPGAPANDI